MLYSLAKVGARGRNDVIPPILEEAVALSPSFNPQQAANSLWAAAILHIDDAFLIRPLVKAAIALSHSFNSQDAANSLWAAATLHIDDASLIRPLVKAAVALSFSFNPQGAANSLWAAATEDGVSFEAAFVFGLLHSVTALGTSDCKK